MLQTIAASLSSSLWRVLLMPLNVLKTTLQVNGQSGIQDLRSKVSEQGAMAVFFRGTAAMMLAQFMGHYPWFAMSNFLQIHLSEHLFQDLFQKVFFFQVSLATSGLWRAALIGIVSSITSDVLTNCIRVVGTYRQTSSQDLSYSQTVSLLLKEGGFNALLFRGLGTKMIVNCLNSIVFSVLLKLW